MPRYDYLCECGARETRWSSVADCDKQTCLCGKTLTIDFMGNLENMIISIPLSFATTGDPMGPQNAEESETWKNTRPYSATGRYGRGVRVR